MTLSLEQHAALFRQSTQGLLVYRLTERDDDRSLQLITANPIAARMLGWTVEQRGGRAFDDDFPQLRPRGIPQQLAEVVRSCAAHDFGEVQIANARGSRETFHCEAFPLPDRCVALTVEDVTPRQVAEKARSQLDSYLSATLHSITDAVISTDTDGHILRMNPVAEQLTGWPAFAAEGATLARVFRIVNGDTRKPMDDPTAQVLRDGNPLRSADNTRLVSRTGSERHIAHSAAPIRDADGRMKGVVLVFRDMTTERELIDKARRAERDLRMALDAVPEAVAIRRGQFFVYVNPAFVRQLGYSSAEEMLAIPAREMVHPDEHARATSVMVRPEGDLTNQDHSEWRFVRKDGSVAIMEWATPRMIEFGGAPAILNSGRDVSERKKLETQLIMSDRLASVGTLAAGVAHEINNPLAYVMANLEIIASELPSFEGRVPAEQLREINELFSVTINGAARISRIVRGLKTFARTDEERRVDLDVRRVLDVSINMVMNEVRHRARLTRNYLATPMINADEARLGQVFVNLLVNAAQAIPAGKVQENEIEITTRTSPNGWASIEIRDTGVGMNNATLARAFDPFFTTNPTGVGTGLGLSICHTLVTALGGRIHIESETGRGTTVQIVIPPATSITLVEEPPKSRPPAGRRARILIIDDEEQIGLSLRTALRSQHEVVPVRSGAEALVLLRDSAPFDLILCDLMMPEMTGIDVHDEIARSMPAYLPKILFMTGGAFTPTTHAFVERFPERILEKPLSLDELREMIARMVRLPPKA